MNKGQYQSSDSMNGMEMQSTIQLTTGDDTSDNHLEPCGGNIGILMKKIRCRLFNSFDVSNKSKSILKMSTLLIAVAAYLIYVLIRWFKSDCLSIDWSNGYGFLFILYSILGISIIYYKIIKPTCLQFINKLSDKQLDHLKIARRWSYNIILLIVVLLFLWISIKDAVDQPRRFLSLAGYFTLLFIAFVFSKHPDYVRWDVTFRGVSLHMLMAFVLIKWKPGRDVLIVVSEKIIGFLELAYVGARFVYGDLLIDLGVFLFKALSVLFFVAMVINVLFYYGVLQTMFRNLGYIMQGLLGTTIIESSCCVSSVFLGMSESPLLFQPYLPQLTDSEFHAVMTCGFGTVAGTVLAAYVSFGADPVTLVTASAMAAPATLTLSKLFYPENRKTKTSVDSLVLHESEDSNAIDAACKGALLGCEIVPAIAANVLSFVSLIACLNNLISWLGMLAGIQNLSFEKLIGTLFIPLAWIMGVTESQIYDVAKLIGIKTAVNEFVGYKEMGVLKRANKLTARSEAIATYAMCGFANPGSVAILVSSLITVCPERREVITRVAFRAFVAGSFASFLSATLAGFITPEDGFIYESLTNHSYSNITSINDTSCYYYSW